LNADLESLARSYARLSRDVGGRINFACDLNNDEALQVAEREKTHLDQAFFVLSFAALENQTTSLACARLSDDARGTAMRNASFEKRWDVAATLAKETLGAAAPWEAERAIVLSWYRIRSDIAHGRAPSQLADVPDVLDLADQVALTFDRVAAVLAMRA
jgi:hypothetical protein